MFLYIRHNQKVKESEAKVQLGLKYILNIIQKTKAQLD